MSTALCALIAVLFLLGVTLQHQRLKARRDS